MPRSPTISCPACNGELKSHCSRASGPVLRCTVCGRDYGATFGNGTKTRQDVDADDHLIYDTKPDEWSDAQRCFRSPRRRSA